MLIAVVAVAVGWLVDVDQLAGVGPHCQLAGRRGDAQLGSGDAPALSTFLIFRFCHHWRLSGLRTGHCSSDLFASNARFLEATTGLAACLSFGLCSSARLPGEC